MTLRILHMSCGFTNCVGVNYAELITLVITFQTDSPFNL